MRRRGGAWDIYVMDADGSNVVPRTSAKHNVGPTWSPDGRRIAFTGVRDETGGPGSGFSDDVYVVSADGAETSPVRLTTSLGWEGQPAWSPDGSRIALSSDWVAYDSAFDIYLVNEDGSDFHPLTLGLRLGSDGIFFFQPAWSPDGRTIALVVCPHTFESCTPKSMVALMNADGSGLRALAQASGYAKPTWSPDGRTIAFSSAGSIEWVRADGGARGVIVANGSSPAWRPVR